MVLRKITKDNSVRYVPKSGKLKEKEIKPKTTKAGSVPRKQNKKLSQNNKKWVASGFGILKRTMKCYFN